MNNARIAVLVVSILLLSAVLPVLPMAAEEAGDEEDTDLVVRYTGVFAEVWGPYALTEIASTIENTKDAPVAHTFAFRLPAGALISNFSIKVNATTYYADVLEAEEAEENYEAAMRRGGTAGLVSSMGDQVFAYSLCFAPGETIRMSLRYEQVLLRTFDRYEYRVNLTCTDDPLPIELFSFRAAINSITPILNWSVEGDRGCYQAEKVDECALGVEMLRRDYTPWRELSVRWRPAFCPIEGNMYFGSRDGMGYFVHVFDPEPAEFDDERIPKDFVFVMDISGSMSGRKFEQSKEALNLIYRSLVKGDRFSFVEFESTSKTYSDDLLQVNKDNIKSMLAYIHGLNAGGGTNIHDGLIDAIEVMKGSRRSMPVIVLLTDGRDNTGIYEDSEFRRSIKENNVVGAAIFSIALGDGADWQMLEKVSLEHNGRMVWITEHESVSSRISDFVRTFSSAMLVNLTFDYGPEVVDVHPRTVRSHYFGSEVLVAGRYMPPAGDITAVITATSPKGPLYVNETFSILVEGDFDFVPRFWAFQRIKALQERMKYNGEDDETVEEIVDIAIDFHFVTDHTSLYVELPEEFTNRTVPEVEGDVTEGGATAPGGIGSGGSQGQGQGCGQGQCNGQTDSYGGGGSSGGSVSLSTPSSGSPSSGSGGWGPCDPVDTGADTDGDKLTNYEEFRAGTNPLNSDTDLDGLDDYTEVRVTLTDPTSRDGDGDGLWDSQEVGWPDGSIPFTGTNPWKRDSDGDGIEDAYDDEDGDGLANVLEWEYCPLNGVPIPWLDPRDPDFDGDGVPDGAEVHGNPDNGGQTSWPLYVDTDSDGIPDDVDPRTWVFDWFPLSWLVIDGLVEDNLTVHAMTGSPFTVSGNLWWNTTPYPDTDGGWGSIPSSVGFYVQVRALTGDGWVPVSDAVSTSRDGSFKLTVTLGDALDGGTVRLNVVTMVMGEVLCKPTSRTCTLDLAT